MIPSSATSVTHVAEVALATKVTGVNAVDELYRAFAAPRPTSVEFCGHCVDPAKVEPFTKVPLRELTAEQVQVYWLQRGVMGDDAFQRYLVPRFLELILAGEIDRFDANYYLDIVSTGYPTWSAQQQVAIDGYLPALWRQWTTVGVNGHDLRKFLDHVACAGLDMTPYLVAVEQSPEAVAELIWDLQDNATGAAAQLTAWLDTPGPLAILEKAALETPDADGRYSMAHYILEGRRVR